jgi:hypothetical protein
MNFNQTHDMSRFGVLSIYQTEGQIHTFFYRLSGRKFINENNLLTVLPTYCYKQVHVGYNSTSFFYKISYQ